MNKKYFLKDRDHSGRFIIKDLESGKEWWVEPIDNSGRPADWGMLILSPRKLKVSMCLNIKARSWNQKV